VKILSSEKYRDSIEEIRIEGHTSSIWNSSTPPDSAYFLNMALSQSRTRSVLQYTLLLPQVADQRDWLKAHLTANGLSSSKRIMKADGTENQDGSQRVEFRVRTNADARIAEILKTAQQ
jgi:outer membrane protein OmpA-like peptidoglycan-associated protein